MRTAEVRGSRRPDSSALAVLVPTAALLPVSLVALAAFWLVVRLVAPVPYWAFAAGYLAAGVLMFLRPVQRLLLSWLYGARTPTPAEQARLEPAWQDVMHQAGQPAKRFVLAVTDSPELNAYACGDTWSPSARARSSSSPTTSCAASSLTSSAITSASTLWR